MQIDTLDLLRLMHLADSALPIGSTAHSFGLETLVEEGELSVSQLSVFLQDYLAESGTFESIFCRRGYQLPSSTDSTTFSSAWLALNAEMSAYKSVRESRVASATLGRRLLQLTLTMHELPLLQTALQAAKEAGIETHHSPAFGLIGALLNIDEQATVLAYLHQSSMSLISACQRMLPLGQNQASILLWQLKPTLLRIEQKSVGQDKPMLFMPLCEIGSMRHPDLTTRLFIS